MGRPENDLPLTSNWPLYSLASWLRIQRKEAGLTYRSLADKTASSPRPLSASTLQRAADGSRIPSLSVVEAYAAACGASVKEASKMWRAARTHVRRPPGMFPKPRLINDSAELRTALYTVYVKAGALPLREMERRAGYGRLPRTTLGRMLNGGTMLKRDQLTAFLEVCEVPVKDYPDWLDAWERAWQGRFGLFSGAAARQLMREMRHDPKAEYAKRVYQRFLERDRALGRRARFRPSPIRESLRATGGPPLFEHPTQELVVTTRPTRPGRARPGLSGLPT
ncbi:helix-turn-helix domain-containing protein [Streptomyces platensis]|uniref:helix-turn-helix domain-containing protein n=1 Tax=Streptomyces platensis TaxID=58346 RepID=UPI0038680241|nr:helix-turn-helix transcriptional regulator [Streptomyces platensis]